MESLLVVKINDLTGFSFFIVSMAMLAATVFFFAERNNVEGKWKLSLSVSGLITGIAAVHYMYMREFYAEVGTSPTELRYVDWILTVPLMCVEFYLILAAIGTASKGILNRLLIWSIVMLLFGYFGEARLFGVSHWAWFGVGMIGWFGIIYEIFKGEASQISADSSSDALKGAFNALRLFVLIGWVIYPLGYVLGVGGNAESNAALNITYNIADAINKIGFGLVIYGLALSDSKK